MLERRNGNADGVAAPFLGNEVIRGERLFYIIRIRADFIHFIDGDDDRNAGGFGVVDGFDRLRHDTVVGGDHENGDIGRLCAARTHGGEGFVTGGIEEGDVASVNLDAVSTDRLRNAARFARGDIGVTDGVEK